MKTQERKKILLVYPPITKFERYSSAIGSSGGQQIPLGVSYLASYLRSNGFEADVIDAEAESLTYENIIQRLQSGGFHVLGISTTTVAFHSALKLADLMFPAILHTRWNLMYSTSQSEMKVRKRWSN
jgi:hypothetical protein